MTDVIRGISALAIDAADPPNVAKFWAALIDGSMTIDEDGDAKVSGLNLPRLDFLKVPERKETKNRIHIDLAVTDLQGATQRAVALGATLADDVYDGRTWQVLRDPEGNEFCLLPPGVS
ncbi:MAG TPA: VOC family protein [Actinomycetes bacterium]|nr:VOC family protein [Actinomycetes bacterium]